MPELPFTLRRLQESRAMWLGAVWLLATLGAAFTGPFGTYEALGLIGRLLYWGVVAGAAVLLHVAFHLGFSRMEAGGNRAGVVAELAIDLGYALLLGAGIWALNRALFEGWESPTRYGWLVLVILGVSFAITALHWIIGRGSPQTQGTAASPAGSGEARFLRRLRVDKRAPLMRIEAQDHYLLVVTRAGSDLLLMRMTDAEAELPPDLGLRVHRSHWVALGAVTGRRRENGRLTLLMADGAEIPVSRGYRAAARDAGLW